MPHCLWSGLYQFPAQNHHYTPLDTLAAVFTQLLGLPPLVWWLPQLTLFYATNFYYIIYSIITHYRTTNMVYQIFTIFTHYEASLLLSKFISQLYTTILHWVIPWPLLTTPSSLKFVDQPQEQPLSPDPCYSKLVSHWPTWVPLADH